MAEHFSNADDYLTQLEREGLDRRLKAMRQNPATVLESLTVEVPDAEDEEGHGEADEDQGG